MVPSTASVNTISGRIDSPGTFALMAFKQESTISPTSSAQSIKKTAAAQFVPRVASIARGDTAVSTPTRAPLDVMVVIGAFTMGIVLVSRMRR